MNSILCYSKRLWHVLLTGILCMVAQSAAFGQPDNVNIDAANALHPYLFIKGQTVNEDIGVDGAGTTDVFWEFDGATPAPVVGASFLFNGITVTLPAVPPASSGADLSVTLTGSATTTGTFFFTLLVAEDGGVSSSTRQYSVTVRAALDLALVLDRSGSMAWGFDGSTTPPANARRWDGLSTGVGILADSLSVTTLVAQDSVGLRYFASAVVTPAAPFNGGLIPMTANIASLSPNVSGQSPSGATALGDGILSARDMLLGANPPHRKVMIVFSDGVQNTGDQVRAVGGNAFLETMSSQQLNGNSNQIEIHTICLGSSGHNPTLMQGIADNNGGSYMNTLAGAESDFSTYFSTLLIDIFSGSTPQYVENSKGVFQVSAPNQPGQMNASFSVNSGVSQVNIFLLTPTTSEPRFTALTKDGTNLIQFAGRRSGPGFIAMTIKAPVTGSGVSDLGGEWSLAAMAFNRGIPSPYTLLVIVDDHRADFNYGLADETPNVDDVLNISLKGTWTGKAIRNGDAQAIILKPGDDINDLLATTDIKFDPQPGDPGTPDAAKLAKLMQDQAFLDKIKAKNQLVDLVFNAADSSYTGSFSPLDLTGVYQVIYQFSADSSAFGKLRRFHHKSFNVRFKDVDMAASAVQISLDASNNTVLSFRPRASNGRFIGPGWGAVITVDAASGVGIQSVNDRGDGTYDLVLTGPLVGTGSISILDEKVYDGNLGDLNCFGPNQNFIQKIQCWLIGLGLPGWVIWFILLLLLILLWLIFRKKKP